MTNPTFIMMVGLPGSGKSTYAHGLLERGYGDELVYLSTDEYVQVRADEQETTYDALWPVLIKEATAFVQHQFQRAIRNHACILWDQTNIGSKKRRAVLQQLPKHYEKGCVYVTCDEELRQQRLLQRPGKTIPRHIDQQMRSGIISPSVDEGFDWVKEVRT